MTDGQRLRWWQEKTEDQAQVLKRVSLAADLLPAAEPVAASEESQDTWAELEAEARRRSQQAVTGKTESVSFSLNRTSVLARHRVLCGIFFVLVVAQLALLAVMAAYHLRLATNVIQTMGTAFCLLSLLQKGKWLREKETPLLRLSPQGMHIDSLRHRNCFLAWDEITAINPKQLFRHRYLEVSGTNRRRYILEERDLTITMDALACRIDVYKRNLHA